MTPQDLQRLQALLNQLQPLSHVQRGELIRAEDWNTLVGSLSDIVRVVLGQAGADVVPSHSHLDQVTAVWLAPGLREIMERGPLADPATQSRLVNLEARLRRMTDQLDGANQRVDEFRGRLTDVITRDLAREAAVTKVQRAVDNVIDPRPDLQAMRSSLAAVQRDLGVAVEAASRLQVNGQVVDITGVVQRLDELVGFRERFRASTGELLDAAGIEQRLVELGNKSVAHGELDDILKNRPVVVSDEALAGVETRLGASLREQVNASLGAATEQIRGEVNNRLAGVNDLVSRAVNDALPGLSQTITGNLNAAIETARAAAIDAATNKATATLATREQAIRTDLNAAVADLRAGIPGAVQAQVAQQLPAQFASLRNDLAAISTRLDAVSAQGGRHEQTLAQQATVLARLDQDSSTIRNDLRQLVLTEIDTATKKLSGTLDDRLKTLDTQQQERIDALSRDLRTQVTEAATKAATDAAANEGRALRTQLLAEIRTVAREEVAVSVRDNVRVAVNEAVSQQFAAVPGMIANELRRTSVTAGGGTIRAGVLVNPDRINP